MYDYMLDKIKNNRKKVFIFIFGLWMPKEKICKATMTSALGIEF